MFLFSGTQSESRHFEEDNNLLPHQELNSGSSRPYPSLYINYTIPPTICFGYCVQPLSSGGNLHS